VQQSIRQLFIVFRRANSAIGTVRLFREQGLKFPVCVLHGPNQGNIVWAELQRTRAVQVLKNPRYAGAFVYGRTRSRKKLDGSGRATTRLPREKWDTLLLDVHAGYITWEEFEENQRRLRENAQAYGSDRRRSPSREGPALLQGLVFCGICGSRMTVRYHYRRERLCSEYRCQAESTSSGAKACQTVPGWIIDEQVGQLLVDAITPVALEVALAVQDEVRNQLQQADCIRRAQVERAQYDAEVAQRRYMKVDPTNRLVASTLETDWNHKLRALKAVEEEYERQRHVDDKHLNPEERSRVMSLATNFPKVWADESVPDRERKRIIRLIIEDVTLVKGAEITAHIRFRGGASRSISVPMPPSGWQMRKTSPEVVERIDCLLDEHTYQDIADIFNARGLLTRVGNAYKAVRIMRIQQRYGLRSREERMAAKGFVTLEEMARLLGLSSKTVNERRKRGLLESVRINDCPEFMYKHISSSPAALESPEPAETREIFAGTDTTVRLRQDSVR